MTVTAAGWPVSRTRSVSPPRCRWRGRCWRGRSPRACRPGGTMDEAYGQSKSLRVWLEDHDQPHVVATRCNDDVVTTSMGRARVDELIAGLPGRAWSRISAGAGAHG